MNWDETMKSKNTMKIISWEIRKRKEKKFFSLNKGIF
jgi:hypothetical protein